jgi:hypothetical protein
MHKREKMQVSGSLRTPDGREVIFLEKATAVPGLGRWIYCKYCYKHTQPLQGDGRIVCGECEYGLGPLPKLVKGRRG